MMTDLYRDFSPVVRPTPQGHGQETGDGHDLLRLYA